MATRQEVILKGLANSPSDYNCQDGELATCLNLINEDGALHPIHQPVVAEQNITLDADDTIELVHKVTHDEAIHSHYIIRKSDDTWYWMEKGGDGTKNEIELGDFNVNSVTAVGNIICFVGDDSTKYVFWNTKKGNYIIFSKSDLDYKIQVSIKKTENSTSLSVDLGEDFWNIFSWGGFGNDSESNRHISSVNADNVIKLFAALDSQMNRKITGQGEGFQKYNTFAVVAFRLYDGSYVNISNIFRLDATYKTFVSIDVDADKKKVSSYSTLYRCSSYCIDISIDNLDKIQDFIQGVDVFVTKGESFVNTNEAITDITFTDGTTHRKGNFYFKYATPSIAKEIIDKMTFYHSVYIPKENFGKKIDIKRITEAETSISLANLYNEEIGGRFSIVYNNRLHIANANVVKKIIKSIFTDSTIGILYDGLIECHTIKGTFWWKGKFSQEDYSFPCLNIQDVTSVIFYRHADESSECEIAEVSLFSSETMAYSFYIGESSTYGIDFSLPWQKCSQSVWNEANERYNNRHNNIETSTSLIKVSDAENPLVFPAKNSVQVGSSIIRALASNTRPISEGQFGDAPLYVFTDEGVWTLTPSTEGTYIARQPANRDICSNPSGILQIDDAVLYPTERGIMMQQGRESVCITDVLDDYPFDFLSIYSHSTKDKTYPNKLLATGKIPESDVKYVHFRKYLEEANMIYDYYDSRIIVFNPYYTYAYVYSLKSKMWGTMHNVFNKRVNIYPESYATDKAGKILDVYVKEPTESVPFFLCSRPLTLGQEVYKTMFDCITRGYFSSIQAGKCGMVLFGSNDLVNWYYISSSVDVFLRSLVGSPYKYFRVALIGKLAPNESISGLSTAFQERLQNKLR